MLSAWRQAASCARGAVPGVRQASFMTRIADGNLGETLVSRSGTLIGSDKAGNKYYENRAYQIGRHRWVVYADQTGYSAASVGSDWHGWLHNVYDNPPSRSVYLHPAYEVPAASGLYGSRRHCGASSMEPGETHLPKGHLKRGRKVWTRFAAWTGAPPAATAAAA